MCVRRLGYYVPDFNANILSLFRDRRLFGSTISTTNEGGVPVDTLHIDNARVTLDTSRDISKVKIRPVRDPRSVPVSQPVMPMLSTAPTTLPYAADLWHRRYGHMPASTMMMLPHVTAWGVHEQVAGRIPRHEQD